MSAFDKLKFWKKDELADLPPLEHDEPAQPPMGDAFPSEPQFKPPSMDEFRAPPRLDRQFEQPVQGDSQLQLISSKLDTIKAQLETVLQRLERLESKSEERPYQQRWRSM